MFRLALGARRLLTVRGMAVRRSSVATDTIGDIEQKLHRLNMTADSIETPFLIDADRTIAEAAHHLATNRLTFAMVTSPDDPCVVGMISERDILKYVTECGDLYFANDACRSQPVRRWMTPRDVMPSVRLDDSIDHALSLIQHRIWRHLPVLDHWNQLHSVLDLRDVVMHAAETQGEDAWRGRSACDVLSIKRRRNLSCKPADEDGRGDRDISVDGRKPSEEWKAQLETYLLSNAQRHTISAQASVETAARQMQRERLTFLAVLSPADGLGSSSPLDEKNRVLGLVTERSFLHFAARSDDGSSLPMVDNTTCEPMEQPYTAPDVRSVGGVTAIMTPLDELLHVSLNDPASKCIELFFSKNATHLPVIDRGHLSGIISVRDLLAPLFPSFL